MTLLNIDANAKTVKGQKKGYMTAILYLSPYILSGENICPMAKQAGCWQTCLNTSGRGGIAKSRMTLNGISMPDNTIQHARLRRTKLWNEDRAKFWVTLLNEIRLFIKKAERKGLTPVVRLNGTSDIRWEREEINLHSDKTIFEVFPDIQFYDYTKIAKRFSHPLPDNYYLCLSYSEADKRYAARCWAANVEHNASIVIVVRNKEVKERYMNNAYNVVDGDEHDLRFLDPPGALVLLKAKGSARRETNGFVMD